MMKRNHTRSSHIPALACGGNNRKPPACRGAPGSDGDRDQDSPRRRHRNWLVWLHTFLLNNLFGGSEKELELSLAIASDEISFEQLAEAMQTTRQLATRRWKEMLKKLRERVLAHLCGVAIDELLRTGRISAVRVSTLLLTEHPRVVSVLPDAQRRYNGFPSVEALRIFVEQVHPLFERNSLLSLYYEAGITTAAVVVPASPNVAPRDDRSDDKWALAF